MAVYTPVPAEALARFMDGYDVGAVRSSKGIAEGVENTTYLVETDGGRFVLTLYEKRVSASDLPFFVALSDHLHAKSQPVPEVLRDTTGAAVRTLCDRPACLYRFLPGLSPDRATPDQARSAGKGLGRMHAALADFAPTRANGLGPPAWHDLVERMRGEFDAVANGLEQTVRAALDRIEAGWPHRLPRSTIHADLFPDNVLMLEDEVAGVIDWTFACTDLRAYDLAVAHGAWAFDAAGERFEPEVGSGLLAGYAAAHPLSEEERSALPVLAQGAALRFLLTRAWDWLHTPADALVRRKDPLAYARRLAFYADPANREIWR